MRTKQRCIRGSDWPHTARAPQPLQIRSAAAGTGPTLPSRVRRALVAAFAVADRATARWNASLKRTLLLHNALPRPCSPPIYALFSLALARLPPLLVMSTHRRAFLSQPRPAPAAMTSSEPSARQPHHVPDGPRADNPPPRPAMPSGAIRARRPYPRHRKGKARAETQLPPAAPTLSVNKQPQIVKPQTRAVESKPHPQLTSTRQSCEHAAPSNSVTPMPSQIISASPHVCPSPQSPASNVAPAIAVHPPCQVQPVIRQEVVNQKVKPFDPSVAAFFPKTEQQNAIDTTSHNQAVAQGPASPRIHPNTELSHQSRVSVHSTQTTQAPKPTQTPALQIPKDLQKSPKQPLSQSEAMVEPADNSHLTVESGSSNNTHGPPCQPSEEAPPTGTSTCDEVPPQPEDAERAELDRITHLISKIKASSDAPRARPLICQDITNSNADTLRISHLPRGATYDKLLSMVEPFGEVEDFTWTASDPYVCEVTYRDPSSAHEAKHFLGDALVGSDSESPLKAELRSKDPGAQLFVGDLTPDVTEEMLEAVFSELVGEPVSALLKRDPDSFSPIGYGFLSFKTETSANFALVAGHRVKVGNACVRVGRAERNTYLYVADLAASVTMDELKTVFGQFGSLVDEDTVIVRRSYAFIRYRNRNAAERAKRTLDKTEMRGRLSVRYAEAEPLKACVAVQFHSSVPRPPNSLRDLLSATFSKHGNCSVEIPRLSNGMWRKVAFVTYHGEPIAANMAALEAVQSIRFVSSLPVCCQFARELIPRLPSVGVSFEKTAISGVPKENGMGPSERGFNRSFLARRGVPRRNATVSTGVSKEGLTSHPMAHQRVQHPRGGGAVHRNGPDFVPVYVPVSALQHSNQQVPQRVMPSSESDFSRYHWQNRMMIPGSNPPPQNVHATYNSFGPLQERPMRW